MAFQFRYKTVQKIRQNTRDEKRALLGSAMAAEREILESLNHLQEQLDALRAERSSRMQAGTLQIHLLRQYAQCETQYLEDIQATQNRLIAAQSHTESCRFALSEADKSVKQFDKLEEKQKERYEEEERRKAA